jgi:diguanylate cyclase (GGDEF)-like protein/hemerythrin-like metal-binding protein
MFAPVTQPIPTLPAALPLAVQSFLAGILVALALLATLAYRPLRDRVLSQAGLFGLVAAAAWITFSGIASALLPDGFGAWIHPAALILGGLCMAIWERVTSDLLATSPGASRLTTSRRITALATLVIALAAMLPWAPAHRISETMLGLLAPLLALLTLTAGLRAHREGSRIARPLVAATLALLVCCIALWTMSVGWMGASASMILLQLALAVLAMALGWAMLGRMTELRRITEAAQAAQLIQAAQQAQNLEALVEQRNAELSARLRDLSEARHSAELANLGLQRAMDQLEQVAATDRLTGAWNRRRFEEAVLPEIALAHRRREPLTLLMFDLDHFKRVNDTFGHGAGDAVLVGTTQCVRQHLRASDALVRWGGEEFLVMAPATRLEGALGLAEKLRSAVAAMEFPGVGQVTMSLGVAEYVPGEGLAGWIERVDQALYLAKAGGRNCVIQAAAPDSVAVDPGSERSLLEVIWEDTYASGNLLIDNQHQHLFRLASSLMSVLTEERPLPEVSLRLETLLAHTAQHFHDEETLLREARYRDLPGHALIHATLLSKARKLQAEVQAGHLDFGKLITFLTLDLVKGHILTEDQHCFAHMLAVVGPEGSPPAGA